MLIIEAMMPPVGDRVGCLSEWLRSCTRNAMGHSRVGSNPAAVETTILQLIVTFLNSIQIITLTIYIKI